MTVPGLRRGFVFSPFGKNGIYTICDADEPSSYPSFEMPETSTDRAEYLQAVESISRACREGEKAVLSRVIVEEYAPDAHQLYEKLTKKYPEAFVFLFHTQALGTWVGASPETLIVRDHDNWKTEALAGTLSADSQLLWDDKNIEEHEIVVQNIRQTLTSLGLTPEPWHRITKVAGPVKHLCTPMHWTFGAESTATVAKVIEQMAPTPALCGHPYDKAMQLIASHEQHSRNLYGGVVGIVEDDKALTAHIHVNLRSLCIHNGRTCRYVGGGITHLSDPETEWLETELKARTLSTVAAAVT